MPHTWWRRWPGTPALALGRSLAAFAVCPWRPSLARHISACMLAWAGVAVVGGVGWRMPSALLPPTLLRSWGRVGAGRQAVARRCRCGQERVYACNCMQCHGMDAPGVMSAACRCAIGRHFDCVLFSMAFDRGPRPRLASNQRCCASRARRSRGEPGRPGVQGDASEQLVPLPACMHTRGARLIHGGLCRLPLVVAAVATSHRYTHTCNEEPRTVLHHRTWLCGKVKCNAGRATVPCVQQGQQLSGAGACVWGRCSCSQDLP